MRSFDKWFGEVAAEVSQARAPAWSRNPVFESVTCDGCGNEVSIDICWCGSFINQHSNPMDDGHCPIAMGCDCFRSSENEY